LYNFEQPLGADEALNRYCDIVKMLLLLNNNNKRNEADNNNNNNNNNNGNHSDNINDDYVESDDYNNIHNHSNNTSHGVPVRNKSNKSVMIRYDMLLL
jgi:hypothetical protein